MLLNLAVLQSISYGHQLWLLLVMYMVTDVTLKYQFYLVGLYKGIKRKSDFFFFPSLCLPKGIFFPFPLCVFHSF